MEEIPNIVPLLGEAHGGHFGSDHPCMISMWMSRGTLHGYMKEHEAMLSVSSRIQLVSTRNSGTSIQFMMMSQIKGTAAELEYCMSRNLVSRALI
jgi:hypothetical protein